ncbi:MAG: hypothetical protein M5R42_18155 [Rhodocyclaceae bacterium]|nr:hypothetical protein [Rhodocyclaceae bacterium]
MKQDERRIDWTRDDTATVLRKLRAADSFPGLADRIAGVDCWLFNAHAEGTLRGAQPGAIIAQRQGALCRATVDGAVWLTHAKRKSDQPTSQAAVGTGFARGGGGCARVGAAGAAVARCLDLAGHLLRGRAGHRLPALRFPTTAPYRPPTACACATPLSRRRSARRRSSC